MKRLMEWAQKWLFDLGMSCSGLPVRYFVGESKRIDALARRAATGKDCWRSPGSRYNTGVIPNIR